MKKVLFIANYLYRESSGATSVAKTHLDVLIKAYGSENVFTIALIGVPKKVEKLRPINFEICSVDGKLIKRIANMVQGHTGKIDKNIIDHISDIVYKYGIDIVFFDDSIYGLAIKKLKKRYPSVIFASYYHDVKRNLCIEWIKREPWKVIKFLPLIYNEYLTSIYADLNLVLNEREQRLFKKYYNKSAELILPVVLPNSEIDKNRVENHDILNILFVGGYYYPNVNGIDWFIRNVYVEIENACTLTIVGNDMDRIAHKYREYPSIKVLGWVDDLSIYYHSADVVIGPIFEGAGMKVKTAEAFSYGKYFLGTQESLEGYIERLPSTLLNRGVFICNDKESYLRVLNEFINKQHFVSVNEEIIEFFEDNYSIDCASSYLYNNLK